MEYYNPYSLGAAIPARIAAPIPSPFSDYEPCALADQMKERKRKAAVTRLEALAAADDDDDAAAAETNPLSGKKKLAPSSRTVSSARTTSDGQVNTKTKPSRGKRLVASSMESQLVDDMMDATSEAEQNLLVSIETRQQRQQQRR